MNLELWSSFLLVAAAQTASPGPTVTFLVSAGTTRGLRATFALMPGIILGDMVLIVTAYLITSTLFSISQEALEIIKIGGGAYLTYLGTKMLFCNLFQTYHNDPEHDVVNNALSGFFITVLNPKGILFFVALLPQFIVPTASFNMQFLILGLTFIVVGFSTDICYVLASSYGSKFLTIRFRRLLFSLAGVSLAGTGFYVLSTAIGFTLKLAKL